MKKFILIIILTILASRERAFAEVDIEEHKNEEEIAQKNKVQLKDISIDEALIEFSKASELSFMVDSTHLQKNPEPNTYELNTTIEQYLQMLSKSHKLTWLAEGKMVLVWSEPDITQMVKHIVDGGSIKLIEAPAFSATDDIPTAPTIMNARQRAASEDRSRQEMVFLQALEYFRTEMGWSEDVPNTVKTIPMSDLPVDLYARIAASVQSTVLRPQQVAIWKSWFDDDFWSNAQLKIIEDSAGPQGQKVPLLTIGGSARLASGSGGSMMSLGAVENLTTN
jgi:type II secretory pathway component GspD/PulD (secretin)